MPIQSASLISLASLLYEPELYGDWSRGCSAKIILDRFCLQYPPPAAATALSFSRPALKGTGERDSNIGSSVPTNKMQGDQSQPMDISSSSAQEKRKAPETASQPEESQRGGQAQQSHHPSEASGSQPEKLDLSDLLNFMKDTRKEMQEGFRNSKTDLNKLWKETQEVKGVASQAAVDASEAKTPFKNWKSA